MNEDKITALTITGDRIITDYKEFRVHDNDSLIVASEALSTIRGWLRKVEATRVELTKPLNDHIKVLNDKFHILTTPAKILENTIIQKIVAYRAGLEKLRAEEQKRLEIEAQTNLTKDALIPEAIPVIVPEQTRSMQTTSGKITFVRVKRWELEDISKIPLEYLKLDDAKITATIKAGREIPGIRSWLEEIPQVRR